MKKSKGEAIFIQRTNWLSQKFYSLILLSIRARGLSTHIGTIHVCDTDKPVQPTLVNFFCHEGQQRQVEPRRLGVLQPL